MKSSSRPKSLVLLAAGMLVVVLATACNVPTRSPEATTIAVATQHAIAAATRETTLASLAQISPTTTTQQATGQQPTISAAVTSAVGVVPAAITPLTLVIAQEPTLAPTVPASPTAVPADGPARAGKTQAPDITLATAEGEFRLSQQRGKVLLLYFSFPG